ncbi:hypothetical protein C8J57DRAFT_1061581 [Mycena rebaudengoi]|nr:hypothetical protein C8J57DRAFT_1061581 [Mycena rebaudengoi]
MPEAVEKTLEKRVRDFLWAEKDRVTVNKETVYAPSDIGGKDLLDIVSRNEAITITWLKMYLSFGEDRPLWCFVADEILALNPLASDRTAVDQAMRLNQYLQSWRVKADEEFIGRDLKKC